MVSVIIPMYNSEKTIIKALDSVKHQTAFNLIKEIIVINDGSTDKSLEVVQAYCENNKYLPIKIIDKENGGVSTARNAGLRIAKGDYIALLDSDDEWLAEKIEKQIDIMEKNRTVGLSATTLNNKKFTRFLFKKFQYITNIETKDIVFKNFFQPSTVIFRRIELEKVGFFPEDQRYAEEGNFFIRFTYLSKCILINESYLNFGNGKRGFGESGLSSNLSEMQKGEIRNLKFAKEQKYISKYLYYVAFLFSYIKYFRRIVITKLR